MNPQGVGRTDSETASNVLGGPSSKFGVPLSQIVDAYRLAQAHGAKKFGMHMMTGSCVMNDDVRALQMRVASAVLLVVCCFCVHHCSTGRQALVFCWIQLIVSAVRCVRRAMWAPCGAAFSTVIRFCAALAVQLGINFDFVNIGGGLGIPYRPEERPVDVSRVARIVKTAFDTNWVCVTAGASRAAAWHLSFPLLCAMCSEQRYPCQSCTWNMGAMSQVVVRSESALREVVSSRVLLCRRTARLSSHPLSSYEAHG